MLIRYVLQRPDADRARAQFALDTLFEGMGVAAVPVAGSAEADLVYAPERPPDLPPQALWMRADAIADWDTGTAQAAEWAGVPVLFQQRPPAPSEDRQALLADLAYATYALLTGALERDQPRNPQGVPLVAGSFLQQQGFHEAPAVAQYTHLLAAALARARKEPLATVPRWPDGKKYAVVLSHDIDTPFQKPLPNFYLRRAWQGLRDGTPRETGRAVLGGGHRTLVRLLGRIPKPADDPNYGFAAWLALEARLGTKGAYYAAVRSCTEAGAHPHDVPYRLDHPLLLAGLRAVLAQGGEVGLHASIPAHAQPAFFAEEKAALEQLLGCPVAGLRHHYWAMDFQFPERTLRAHAEAGFRYDSSLGHNDAPGFRRGAVWPFQPFDRERGARLPILQIPPTLMDGNLFYQPIAPDDARTALRKHFDAVSAVGGAVVLDWHLAQLNPDRLHGAGPALVDILLARQDDGDLWWAAPYEMADWWQQRRARIWEAAGQPVPEAWGRLP